MKGRRKRQFMLLAVMLFAFFIAFSGSPKRAFAASPGEEKAITLLKNGEAIGNYNTLNQAINKMYDLTHDGSRFNFVVQVNKDIELTEYSQFSFPYGEVTLKSKDKENPRTIKGNNPDHRMMLGVVNGAHLTVEDIIIDGNKSKRLFWVQSTEDLPASLTINKGAILQNGKVDPEDQTKHGAAIYCQDAGNVTINGGIIRNNEALSHGGAICDIGTGTLTINGGEISGNKAPASGGAIYLQGKEKLTEEKYIKMSLVAAAVLPQEKIQIWKSPAAK